MRQTWPRQSKNSFEDLFARGKPIKVSVLELQICSSVSVALAAG